jgi:putative transposase
MSVPIKDYYSDENTVFSCQYHVIFTPKYRRKVLEQTIANRLSELLVDKQEFYNYRLIEHEVMIDHVYLLIEIPPSISVKQMIAKIKGSTSRMLKREFPSLNKRLPCLWTRSFFVSTVGAMTLDVVEKYIQDQKEV